MFLEEPPATDAGRSLQDDDRESQGYVDNLTRLWCWRPELLQQFSALRGSLIEATELSAVDLAVLDASTAAARQSSYCALAKGCGLAGLTDTASAAAVVAGSVDGLDPRTVALANWDRVLQQFTGRLHHDGPSNANPVLDSSTERRQSS